MSRIKSIAFLLAALIALAGISFAAGEGLEIEYEAVGGPLDSISEGDDVAGIDVEEAAGELDAFNLSPEASGADTAKGTGARLAYSLEIASCVPGGADNDVLFSAFVNRLFTGRGAVVNAPIGPRLTGLDASLYRELKDRVGQVASGALSDTAFAVPIADVGLAAWTAGDLGLSQIVDDTGALTADAAMAIFARLGQNVDLEKLLNALLFDCPFDLFWFDRTALTSFGIEITGDRILQIDGQTVCQLEGALRFSFPVARDYADQSASLDTQGRCFTTDASRIAAVQDAANNAQAVVSANAGRTDLEKLKAYRAAICDSVDYNDAAAGLYGNPWQLVWVFDGDPDTKVVSEGYAKAFQYLCDMSAFTGGISCCSVTGTANGKAHMWNVVTMDNDENYLVDVTSCDDGTPGGSDALFLVGASGSPTDGYTFPHGDGAIAYRYDAATLAAFPERLLALSDSGYPTAPQAVGHHWSAPEYRWSADNSAVTAARACTDADCGETETETVATTSKVTRMATCTEKGETTWTTEAFSNPVFLPQIKAEVNIPARGHIEVVCIAVAPTCTEAGKTEGRYCAACGAVIVAQQSIEALGHDWDAPAYAWADDNSSVTAQCECKRRCGAQQTETAYTTATSVPGSCTEPRKTTWTAVFTNPLFAAQEKTETFAAPSHDWGEPMYNWSHDFGSVTAARYCMRSNCDASEKETVETTSQVTRAATTTELGETTYTATFVNPAFTKQTKSVDNIPMLVSTGEPTPSPSPSPLISPSPSPSPSSRPSPTPTPEAPVVEPTAEPTSTPTPTPKAAIKISGCTVAIKAQVYTGKALKPSVSVKYNGKALKKGRDYSVAFRNNVKVGTATATITGHGDYTGSKKVSFAINPKALKLARLKAGEGGFTAKWKPLTAQVDGYQIEYSLKKSFSGGKTATVKGAAATEATVGKLNARARYFVRIRAWRRVGRKTYYSAWSRAKRVRTK